MEDDSIIGLRSEDEEDDDGFADSTNIGSNQDSPKDLAHRSYES